MIKRWDKIDTPQDHFDYTVNADSVDLISSILVDTWVLIQICPIARIIQIPNCVVGKPVAVEYAKFYRQDDNYELVPNGSIFYGFPIYNPDLEWTTALQAQADAIATDPDNEMLTDMRSKRYKARLFKHAEMPNKVFDELYDPR
jgi:hypothetical protein